ncbi:hypothetical protein [Aurantiacibacter spongiae]|uniref:Lipoprotein n=1 Tax=Aurantiacibacter spongiae TaxID=2488860 RepID=A0A3N5DJ81_9SPHN|nr:hypothetical protein [Aurantiacibacter spongiae]RPF70745.1 hypothetical protein EG799_03250 [Aurantiacibacter spongiae]
MRVLNRTTVLTGLALLAACNRSDEPADDVASAPEPVLTTAPTPTRAPDGTAYEAGSWQVKEDAGGAMALYGEAQTEAHLTIACDRATNTLTLALASDASAPEAWRIDAGREAARLDMVPRDGQLPELEARLSPSAPVVRAMTMPGQSIVLTDPAGQKSQFPTHSGISRVLDACS